MQLDYANLDPAKACIDLSTCDYTVTSYRGYSDGFRITLATELEAYKAAHYWQQAHTEVYSNHWNRWVVNVYFTD